MRASGEAREVQEVQEVQEVPEVPEVVEVTARVSLCEANSQSYFSGQGGPASEVWNSPLYGVTKTREFVLLWIL